MGASLEAILGPDQRGVNPGESGSLLSREKQHKVGTNRERFSHFGKSTAESIGKGNDSINPQMGSSCPHPTPTHGHPVQLLPPRTLFPHPKSSSAHTAVFGFLFVMKEFKELGYQKADGFPGLESP